MKRTKKETPSQTERAVLAKNVFDCVYERHDFFREDNIGADLAYLMGAILDDPKEDPFVEWSPEAGYVSPLLPELRQEFAPDHILWQFIRLGCEGQCQDGVRINQDGVITRCDTCYQYDTDRQAADAVRSRLAGLLKEEA
jgi:hypothetical protein